MKILVTGATASQASHKKNARLTTFPKLLVDALESSDHEVEWTEPSVYMSRAYLSEFDSVIVGLAPPNSTAAYRIYGALSVVSYASDIGNLTLLIDAPEPKRLWAGLRAVHKAPDTLTKEFYSKRREYKTAISEKVLTRLHDAVDRLYSHQWPKTIYPTLPWMSFPSVMHYIHQTDASNLVGLNFDAKLLEHVHESALSEKKYWVSDAISSAWTRRMEKLVANDVVSVSSSRWEDQAAVNARIASAIGCMVSTYKYGDPWWSPHLAQSLALGVPVVTDWRLSSFIGEPWTVIAATIDDMSSDERSELAVQQLETYADAIPSWDQSVDLLDSTIREQEIR